MNEVPSDGEHYRSNGCKEDTKDACIMEVSSVIYRDESSSMIIKASMQSVLTINLGN